MKQSIGWVIKRWIGTKIYSLYLFLLIYTIAVWKFPVKSMDYDKLFVIEDLTEDQDSEEILKIFIHNWKIIIVGITKFMGCWRSKNA
jgi:MFS superfamily sulfate permease-like transporter